MNWTKDKSIKLSLVCVYIFAFALFTLDIFPLTLASRFDSIYAALITGGSYKICFLTMLYSASVFGWICLYKMFHLLKALQRGEVFTRRNVSLLRAISWCFAAAAAIFFVGAFWFTVFFCISICAAFMMLIVRIVKNAFQQAVEMKDELDLTI